MVEDRDRILADIENDVGVLTMSHQLKDELVDSVASSIPPDDKDHPWTLKLSKELAKTGKICQLYARYAEAEVFLGRDLRGCQLVLGQDHPDTLRATENLATLLQAQGKLSEAEPLLRRVLEVRGRLLDPDHPDTLHSMHDLAWLLHIMGNKSEPEVLCRKALEIQSKSLGPDHPDTLTTMGNLSSLL